MRKRPFLYLSLLAIGSLAVSCGSERALWIEVTEGGRKTTLAMTEGIARQLLEMNKEELCFPKEQKGDRITREMLQNVLDGRQRTLTIRDEEGSETLVYMKPLSSPGGKGKERLVLEVYKEGRQTFRLALPDFEQVEEKSGEVVGANFDWKALLPFLAKSGGAMYMNDPGDNTEVWVYVE